MRSHCSRKRDGGVDGSERRYGGDDCDRVADRCNARAARQVHVSTLLIAVIVASGFIRVLEATGSSTVSAIGNARELVC